MGGAVFMISGTYHVGADTPHWTLTREVLQPVRERSITARIVCVPDLSDENMILEGAGQYAACARIAIPPLERLTLN